MSPNAADTWMPLYIADWEADTLHLTCEEDGAYGRLIRWYWRNGPPADDDRSLARIVRVSLAVWRKLRPAVSPYFAIEGGRWRHRRVDRELETARERYERRAAAGRKGGSKPRASGSNAGAMLKPGSSNAEATHNSHSSFGESPSQGEVHHDVRAVGSGQVVPLRREGDR